MGLVCGLLLTAAACNNYPDNRRVPAPEHEGRAIETVRRVLEERVGTLPDPTAEIIWVHGAHLIGYGRGATAPAGAKLTGVYYDDPPRIYLTRKRSIAESSFVHELLHHWRDISGRGIDPKHADKPWWLIYEHAAKRAIWEWESDLIGESPGTDVPPDPQGEKK